MSTLSRRDLMLTAGAVGLLGVGQQTVIAEDKAAGSDKLPTIAELAGKLKLSDQEYERLRVIPNLQLAPVASPSLKGGKTKEVARDAEPIEIKDASGKRVTYALQWTCPTDVINLFNVNGSPFVAKRFTFNVSGISWQAGDGWPVYTQYCPRDDYSTGMWYRHAKVHQIVPSIKEQNYFIGCLSSAICESANPGQVCFAVNDGGGDYGDNRGAFVVTITNWN